MKPSLLLLLLLLLLCLLCGCGEKPIENEYRNALFRDTATAAPMRVQVDGGYMTNGLIVVTNLRSATNTSRCEKCGYSNADAPTNQWPDAEISRDRFRAMLDNEAVRRQHAFQSNQHYWLHGEGKAKRP